MSKKKYPQKQNKSTSQVNTSNSKETEEEAPKYVKKKKRKAKIISKERPEFEADEEKLAIEITSLLKKARSSIAQEDYLEAVKCYQNAAIAASMIGDLEREKIYLSRASEIIREHPELKEKGVELFKRRKLKAKIREKEEKFSIFQFFSQIFIAGILLVLVYSGLFSAIILQELFEMGGSYNVAQLWGICITIEICGIILAYFLGKRLFQW
ncbi:MAG: hypothetical protein ACTSYB_08820 [Candidatus Helarchaeota archaeon]